MPFGRRGLDRLGACAGWQRIGLLGHSLGAIKAVYSQAHTPHAAVRRVLALSPPRLCYRTFQNDPLGAAFFDAITAAQRHVAAGEPEALIRVHYPFPMLITASGYVEKYGPAERYNVVPLVARVGCPLLFAYGQLELDSGSVAFAGVPEALREAARAGQALDIVTIPAPTTIIRAVSLRLPKPCNGGSRRKTFGPVRRRLCFPRQSGIFMGGWHPPP